MIRKNCVYVSETDRHREPDIPNFDKETHRAALIKFSSLLIWWEFAVGSFLLPMVF